MQIVLISDTHLAQVATAFTDNARAAVAWIEAQRPDLVIHLGDVTADGVADPAQFAHAREVLGAISAPLLVIPGNHDVGENPPGGGVREPAFDAARLADFRAAFGEDRWRLDGDGWTLIGLDVQLFGSATAEEDAQARWLEAQLADAPAPVALFLHKPLFLDDPDDATDHTRFVPPVARRWLAQVFAGHDLRLVVSGHVHQQRRRAFGQVEHLWAPSTAFLLPDAMQPVLGDKRVGLTVLDLTDGRMQARTVTPPGMAAHDVLDHPEVYPQVVAFKGQRS